MNIIRNNMFSASSTHDQRKRFRSHLIILIALCMGAALPNSSDAQPVARIDTVLGEFFIELTPDAAPLTVANFLNYVRDGDYTGTFFHRSATTASGARFVLQGGGFGFNASTNTAFPIAADLPVDNEFNVSNTRGTVAMAKLGGNPNSATNQWFVNLGDNSANLDNQNGGFTVFGRVLGDGMTVVDAIAALPVNDLDGPTETRFNATPTINFTGFPVQAENLVILNSVDELELITPPVASVLPSGRSVRVGTVATGFATIINTASPLAASCSLAPATTVAASFSYQTTNAMNVPIGVADSPVDIAGNGAQTFLFSFTPTGAIPTTEVAIDFSCANAGAAVALIGVNTFSLSATTAASADIVALAATLTGLGISEIPGSNGTGVFSVATANVGDTESITVTADTGSASLPVNVFVCQTNPATAACLQPLAAAVSTTINANETSTFSFFVQGTDTVEYSPGTNRVFARFNNSAGEPRGSTSVAIRTIAE